MKVYGSLDRAALETITSEPAVGVVGRVWWNSTLGRARLDDGTNIRAFLRNDLKCVVGNSGTASQNIRFHRGAAGVIQLVTGDDATAEGTLSTSLNQLSTRFENYSTVGRPAFGNAGRIIWDTDLQSLVTDTGSAWVVAATGSTTTRVNAMYVGVLGSAAQVTSGAATHSSWASLISALSDGDSVYVLKGSITENVSISKKLNITGSGYGSVLDGTLTFASGSSDAVFKNIKVTGNITINSGVSVVQILEFWLGSSKTITNNGTGTFIQGVQE